MNVLRNRICHKSKHSVVAVANEIMVSWTNLSETQGFLESDSVLMSNDLFFKNCSKSMQQSLICLFVCFWYLDFGIPEKLF